MLILVTVRPKPKKNISCVTTTLELNSGSKHVICSSDEGQSLCIPGFEPLADFLIFSHVTCNISTHIPNSPFHRKKSSPPPRPNWRKLTTHDLKRSYTSPLEASLSHLPFPSLSDYSSNPHLIDRTLSHLISLMKSTANTNIPSKHFLPHQTPEWDDELKQAQKAANTAHKAWRNAGKPRNPDHPL